MRCSKMLRSHQKPLSGYALRDAGWNALVRGLGLVNATRFILQYESGYGEYAKIKKELFKGKSVDDIFKEIERCMAKCPKKSDS
jgi:hypothetical protein